MKGLDFIISNWRILSEDDKKLSLAQDYNKTHTNFLGNNSKTGYISE